MSAVAGSSRAPPACLVEELEFIFVVGLPVVATDLAPSSHLGRPLSSTCPPPRKASRTDGKIEAPLPRPLKMETSLGFESESLFRTQEDPPMETGHPSSFWPSQTPNPAPDAETTGSLETSPTPSTDAGISEITSGSPGAGDGLSTGAVVGIAVGAAIGGLLVGSLLIWLLVRRLIRARHQDRSDARSAPEEERDVASPTSPKEHVAHVARRPASPVYEMDNSTMRQQLDDTGTKGEMDGWSPSLDGDEKFQLGEPRDARSPKE